MSYKAKGRGTDPDTGLPQSSWDDCQKGPRAVGRRGMEKG